MSAEDFVSAKSFYGEPEPEPESKTPVNDKPEQRASPGGIVFLPHDDLFAPEQVNQNLVVPELGIGAGPPNGFFGQGFVGKTIMAMSLGMSVALGQPVWGRFRVKQGVWVHFDYEQGRRETKKRIQRLASGFGVGKEELRDRIRIAVYPEVNLTSADALKHYIQAMSGATIATFDALKGITPGIEENSSSMRDYMRILSVASEQTGCAVLLIHHAGKFDPKKARKEMGRGSSGIYDECQSVFVITGGKEEDKRVTHEKDRELGETVPEFGLRFDNVGTCESESGDVSLDGPLPTCGLRVVVVGQAATQRANRVVDYLTSQGGAFEGSKTDLVRAMGMNRSEFYAALLELERAGRVRIEGKSTKENRPRMRISLIHGQNADSSHRPESSLGLGDGLGSSPHEIVPPSRSLRTAGRGTISSGCYPLSR